MHVIGGGSGNHGGGGGGGSSHVDSLSLASSIERGAKTGMAAYESDAISIRVKAVGDTWAELEWDQQQVQHREDEALWYQVMSSHDTYVGDGTFKNK